MSASHDALRRLRFDNALKQLRDPSRLREEFNDSYWHGTWPPLWVRCRAAQDASVDAVLIAPDTANTHDEEGNGRVYVNPIFLDTTSQPWSMTIVLREWSLHVIDFNLLQAWSPETQRSTDWRRWIPEFQTHAVDDGGEKRWDVQNCSADDRLLIDTRALGDVTQRVGRLSFSPSAWPFEAIRGSNSGGKPESLDGSVDIVLVPRLTGAEKPRKSHRGAPIIFPAELDDKARSELLSHSPIASVSTARFQAMLSLAAGFEVDWRTGTTFSPVDAEFSALALFPLVTGLERAVQALRHEYMRQRQVRRAPSGSLRVAAYASQVARGRPDRVPVHRFERTVDHLENQFYSGMCRHLRRVLAGDPSRLATLLCRRVRNVEALLGAVTPTRPTVSKADKLLHDPRLAPERRETVGLARRALLGRFPGLSPDGEERTPAQSFEVSIPDLFEEERARCVG